MKFQFLGPFLILLGFLMEVKQMAKNIAIRPHQVTCSQLAETKEGADHRPQRESSHLVAYKLV